MVFCASLLSEHTNDAALTSSGRTYGLCSESANTGSCVRIDSAEGNLQARVRRLLEPCRTETGPSAATLRIAAFSVLMLACAGGASLHWIVQAITRLP